METKSLLREIENRFIVALAVAAFFPPAVHTFLEAIHMDPDKIAKVTASWSLPMGMYLLAFLIFQFYKTRDISFEVLRVLRAALFLALACYAFPIICLSIIQEVPSAFRFIDQVNGTALWFCVHGIAWSGILLWILTWVGLSKRYARYLKKIQSLLLSLNKWMVSSVRRITLTT